MRQSGPQFSADLICRLPDLLRRAQENFDRTGGIHAAALFSTEGELLGLREDVGRHNAVDKLIGFALRDGSRFKTPSFWSAGAPVLSLFRSQSWRRSRFSLQ
jgi:formate dehydrogenase accessory protein FdhD